MASQDRNRRLNISSVGSVGSYLLPPVFRAFLEEAPGRALTFHNYHSQEAYDYVAQGPVDVALISNDMYHPQVEEFLIWPGEWSDSWVIAPAIAADALQKRCGVRPRHLKEGPPDEIIYYLLGRKRKPELTAAFLDCLDRELQKRGVGESYLKKTD